MIREIIGHSRKEFHALDRLALFDTPWLIFALLLVSDATEAQ